MENAVKENRLGKRWVWLLSGFGAMVMMAAFGALVFGALRLLPALLDGSFRPGSACAWRPSEKAVPVLSCRVVDPEGRLASGAEVRLKPALESSWQGSWTVLEDGTGAVLNSEVGFQVKAPLSGRYDVLIRTREFAPAQRQVTFPVEASVEFTVEEGNPVVLRLLPFDDHPLPEGLRPAVLVEDLGFMGWLPVVTKELPAGSLLPLVQDSAVVCEALGDGRYRCVLPRDCEAFRILVDHPGFLRCFLTGKIDVDDAEAVEIRLPVPGRVDLALDPATLAVGGDRNAHVSVGLMSEELGAQVAELGPRISGQNEAGDWFAPGEYSVSLHYSLPKAMQGANYRVEGDGELRVGAGETLRRVLRLVPIEPGDLQGDGKAVLTVLRPNGAPAEGLAYVIHYSDSKIKRAAVAAGRVGPDGRIRLDNLRDDGRHETFYVSVDGEYLGHFFFRGRERYLERTFTLPVAARDRAPDCRLVTVQDESPVDLAHLRGKIVYLDFWATWCGPCQGPMAELQQLAETHAVDWRDRVALIGVSLDEDRQTALDWVRERGWEHSIQTWAPEGGWSSEAAVRFGVRGVPTGILIDPQGTVVWRGHPGNRTEPSLDERILKLLAER